MDRIIKENAATIGIPFAALRAIIEVETGGIGFEPVTGKILIQFEPAWFRKHVPYAPSGLWSANRVERQAAEWDAFNNAYAIDPEGAMKSTSIGMGQIMGFHYRRLGYATVGAMWDDAKKGIDRQIRQICLFLRSDKRLMEAIIKEDWTTFATIYNGTGFRELAKKYNRVPYDMAIGRAYQKWKKIKI